MMEELKEDDKGELENFKLSNTKLMQEKLDNCDTHYCILFQGLNFNFFQIPSASMIAEALVKLDQKYENKEIKAAYYDDNARDV